MCLTYYIASGDYYDWTKKVDLNKDFVIEPLFFTQTEEIDFMDREDKDYLNDLNLNEFGEVFGMLKVDSQNELLKGKRDVKTQTPPTPVTQIQTGAYTNGNHFIIPQIYAVEHGSNPNYILQKIPMSPHTRLLFYNGLIDTNIENGGPQPWYDELNNTYYNFPMVGYYEEFPNTPNTLNLNWQIETGYIDQTPVANDPLVGQSCYDEYWSQYIDSLYSKYSNTSVKFSGKTPTAKRRSVINEFRKNPKRRIFIGQIKAAGTGVDSLQEVSNTSAVIELPWDPGTLSQFFDRIHRLGQSKNVTIYIIIAKNTIEERLCRIIQEKQDNLTKILDGKEKLKSLRYNIYDQLERELLKGKHIKQPLIV